MAYAFSVRQLKLLLEVMCFTEKAKKNPEKPAYSLAPKKSSQEVPNYKPVKRAATEMADKIYTLVEPLLALIPADQMLLASDVEKRKRESPKGWNAYACEDPNILLALVIFKNISNCDLLIKGLLGNPMLHAKRYFSNDRPAVLVAMKLADLKNREREIKNVVKQSIEKNEIRITDL